MTNIRLEKETRQLGQQSACAREAAQDPTQAQSTWPHLTARSISTRSREWPAQDSSVEKGAACGLLVMIYLDERAAVPDLADGPLSLER